jgi:hypothetical protein
MDTMVNLTSKELTVLSDILRRLPTTGLFTSQPEFETALEKIDDAKVASFGL